MGTLNINLLDTSFSIQAEEDSEYMKKLLGYVERISTQIKNSGMLENNTQIAIMTGIMLCDELYKEKTRKIASGNGNEDYYEDPEESQEMERRTLEMIEKISKVV